MMRHRDRRERHGTDRGDHHAAAAAENGGAHRFSRLRPGRPLSSALSRLFSRQMYSRISSLRCRYDVVLMWGSASTTGSIKVVWISIHSELTFRMRSTMRSRSLWGTPGASSVDSVKPTESTTSVSPSQCPVE